MFYAARCAPRARRTAIARRERGGGGLRVSVEHLPMQVCTLGPRTFVLARGGAADVAPVSPPGLGSATLGGLLPAAGADGYSLEDEAQVPDGITLHAHSLFDLARQMDVRFRLFAVGPAARATARLVARLQAAPRLGLLSQTLRDGAALVIVDRTLDLVAPTLHGDSLLDAALAKLRPESGPAMDDACPLDAGVPTRPRGGADGAAGEGPSSTAPPTLPAGSLGELPPDGPEGALLEALVESRAKKASLALRKALKEAVAAHKLTPPKTKGRLGTVSSAEVEALRATLAGDHAFRHRHLLCLADLGAAALERDAAGRWSSAAKAEKMGIVSAADGLEGLKSHLLEVLEELRELLAESPPAGAENGKRSMPGPDALAALGQVLAAFSLVGDFPPAESEEFLWGGADSELSRAVAAVEALRPEIGAGTLRDISTTLSSARASQRGLRYLLPRAGGVDGSSYSPLLRQALSLALSGQEQATHDVVPVSSTVGGLLKSGLKGLGFEARGVGGSDTVVLFVIGGITAAEAAEAREAFAELHGGVASGVELIIGGTRLLHPDSLAQALLSPPAPPA